MDQKRSKENQMLKFKLNLVYSKVIFCQKIFDNNFDKFKNERKKKFQTLNWLTQKFKSKNHKFQLEGRKKRTMFKQNVNQTI